MYTCPGALAGLPENFVSPGDVQRVLSQSVQGKSDKICTNGTLLQKQAAHTQKKTSFVVFELPQTPFPLPPVPAPAPEKKVGRKEKLSLPCGLVVPVLAITVIMHF